LSNIYYVAIVCYAKKQGSHQKPDEYWPIRVHSKKLTAKSRAMLTLRISPKADKYWRKRDSFDLKNLPDAIDLHFEPCDWVDFPKGCTTNARFIWVCTMSSASFTRLSRRAHSHVVYGVDRSGRRFGGRLTSLLLSGLSQ
jgi:hypothetical protein